METVKRLTSTRTMLPDSQNDNKENNLENKLHSLKEVPKKGLLQIKESFRTLKNVNRQLGAVKGVYSNLNYIHLNN